LKRSSRHLKEQSSLKYVRKEIVKRTHGFEYEKHFRRMLIQLLGIISVGKIEKRVDQSKRESLVATLKTLKDVRDPEAHTHIKGTTRRIDAPSVTLNRFSALYDGLIEFDSTIKKLK
jgi:hypothetical protein